MGANCSIQCVCNGHSNCEGPDKLDKCLECHNNTMVMISFGGFKNFYYQILCVLGGEM